MKFYYSIIIPAYNEEALLPAALGSLKQSMCRVPHEGEVIVVDNNSVDGTAVAAAGAGATVIFEPFNQISRARNSGAAAAQGGFLIFLDADSAVTQDLLAAALNAMAAEGACGGGALPRFDEGAPRWGISILNVFNRIAPKLGIAPGGFFFCRKDVFHEVGGFSEKLFAGEEIDFSRRLKKYGRSHGMPFTVLTSPCFLTSHRKLKHPWRVFLQALMGILFPISPRFKSLCWLWYRR